MGEKPIVPRSPLADCAAGYHPMSAVVRDGQGGISCAECGASGREDEATAHPHGEFCRKNGCHPWRPEGGSEP